MGGEAGSRSAACATAHVRSEEAGGALVVSLHRPPLNVLDLPTIRALQAALEPLPARRDLKALVLRSGIEGVFSAGVDVRDHALERVPGMREAFHAVFRLLDALPQATLAAVGGPCRWVERLTGKSGVALAAARKILRSGGGFEPALREAERIYREDVLPSEDVEEGLRAFLRKRRPRWRDR